MEHRAVKIEKTHTAIELYPKVTGNTLAIKMGKC